MRYFFLTLIIAPSLVLFVSTRGVKALPINNDIEITQTTKVKDLKDVQPTDWAYSALQNLLQRYGFPQGYPDNTFRGNRTLTRYEFAAALNSLLDSLVNSPDIGIAPEDLETLYRLQVDFGKELTAIKSQVDELDNRISSLESDRFSTTTKLSGQIIFAATAAFGDNKAVPSGDNNSDTEAIEDNVTFSDRVRLYLDSSFTGQDLLRMRLLAANIANLNSATGTDMARLSFDRDTENQLNIDLLYYQFPVGDKVKITLMPLGTIFMVADPLNPLLGSDDLGSPFLFGVRSPIYREEIGGTGFGISYDPSSQFNLSAVYLARSAADPNPGFGLFNGAYSALGQVTWKPNSTLGLGLVYSHSYNAIDINAAGQNTNAPFGEASDAISADSYGIVANWEISPQVSIGGWAGWVRAQAEDLDNNPTAEILYYTATLALPNLVKEGDLLGFAAGQPPRLIENEVPGIDEPDPAFNLEAFYRFPASDRIAVTPGLLVIFNPEHNNDNDTIYVGTIRTTFSF
ncbi:MAG: iron uptake porin [Pleurocapsa sp.]